MQFLNAKNYLPYAKGNYRKKVRKETNAIKKAVKCPKSKSNRGKDRTKNTQIYIQDSACSIVRTVLLDILSTHFERELYMIYVSYFYFKYLQYFS